MPCRLQAFDKDVLMVNVHTLTLTWPIATPTSQVVQNLAIVQLIKQQTPAAKWQLQHSLLSIQTMTN
eukprot:144341-Amphidinium_carterae.1